MWIYINTRLAVSSNLKGPLNVPAQDKARKGAVRPGRFSVVLRERSSIRRCAGVCRISWALLPYFPPLQTILDSIQRALFHPPHPPLPLSQSQSLPPGGSFMEKIVPNVLNIYPSGSSEITRSRHENALWWNSQTFVRPPVRAFSAKFNGEFDVAWP